MTRLHRILDRIRRLPQSARPSSAGWSVDQQAVIEAGADMRMIVQGGPGTGKTAVACARIAHLIQTRSLAPDSIWVVSFTRIAVREIRERIATLLGPDQPGMAGLSVLTLDSLAGRLHPSVEEASDYDFAVAELIRSMAQASQVRDRLAPLRHLLIDEAHDVIGVRADLLETMIAQLPDDCGVTVCADDAQSIYSFADRSRMPKPALPQRLNWPTRGLEVIHRAKSPRLVRLFQRGRRIVLDPRLSDAHRTARLHKELRRAADRSDTAEQDITDHTLVLYRNRADVLAASTRLLDGGTPHRVRTSGHPTVLAPWIAVLLGAVAQPSLSRSRFQALWEKGIKAWPSAPYHGTPKDEEDAWTRLYEVAGRAGQLDLPRLRARLMEASPPIALCSPEVGVAGPLISTIHASKGREAPHVVLTLAPAPDAARASAEEARTLYVGATRAQHRLSLVPHHPLPAKRLASGRIYHQPDTSASGVTVEFGAKPDLTAEGLVGRRTFASVHHAGDAQARWRGCKTFPAPLTTEADPERRYGLYLDGSGLPSAFLSDAVTEDLDELRLSCLNARAQMPATLPGLYLVALRTLVVDPTQDYDANIYFPWSESGIILAPVILGLRTVIYGRR